MNTRDYWRRFDIPLFAAVLLLCIFGIALISSAIAGNPTLEGHPKRQAVFMIIGLVALFGSAAFDYRIWQTISKPFYGFVLILLLFVFIMGAAKFGAARWLETGLVTLQPAELAKIAIILNLSSVFATNIANINS